MSYFSAAKGEKLAPICLSATFGKIDEKSCNPVQAYNAVLQLKIDYSCTGKLLILADADVCQIFKGRHFWFR